MVDRRQKSSAVKLKTSIKNLCTFVHYWYDRKSKVKGKICFLKIFFLLTLLFVLWFKEVNTEKEWNKWKESFELKHYIFFFVSFTPTQKTVIFQRAVCDWYTCFGRILRPVIFLYLLFYYTSAPQAGGGSPKSSSYKN